MCGRFALHAQRSELAAFVELPDAPEVSPRYNIAPTQPLLALRLNGSGQREWVHLRWGLVPSWAKRVGDGPAPINARADSVVSKPMFRSAFRSRRCLIPANGFYEWQTLGKTKQPFLFRRRDARLVAFAGLWERWRDPNGDVLESCAVLTTEANDVVRPVHDRMPAFLEPRDFELWLSNRTDVAELTALLVPYPAEELIAMPVSRLLNNSRNEGPDLLRAS